MGAQKPDLAERYANTSARIGMAMFSVFGLLIALYAEPILRFWNPDPRSCAPRRRSCAWSGGIVTPVISAALVYTQALYGAGNTIFVMVAEARCTSSAWCRCRISRVSPLASGSSVCERDDLHVCALAFDHASKFRSGDWKHIHI